MNDDARLAIRAVIKERRILLNRIAKTEAKLSRLKSHLVLCEVKLICFGHNVDRLR